MGSWERIVLGIGSGQSKAERYFRSCKWPATPDDPRVLPLPVHHKPGGKDLTDTGISEYSA
jgi:hypothetical protein